MKYYNINIPNNFKINRPIKKKTEFRQTIKNFAQKLYQESMKYKVYNDYS